MVFFLQKAQSPVSDSVFHYSPFSDACQGVLQKYMFMGKKSKAQEALFNKVSLVLVYLYTQVVAALEIVQLRFGVVVIASVA